MRIGVNLYGLEAAASQGFYESAKTLAGYGYGSMEPLVMLSCDRKEMEGKPFVPTSIWQQSELIERSRFLKETYDIKITTCHLGGLPEEDFSKKTDSMIEIIESSDVRDFVMSRMLSTEGACKRDAEIFNMAAEKLAPYGGRMLYHNHEAEQAIITVKHTERMVLDYFFSLCREDVMLEADVGWVMFSGVDPTAFLHEHRDRLARLHLKDFRRGFQVEKREQEIVAVGSGALPLREILAAALELGLRDDSIIVDQDLSPSDLLSDLGRGIVCVDQIIRELGA